jgi:hypothetical protein
MAAGTFATTINCIDGRAQRPVSEWIRVHHTIDFVDTVTYPGPEKALTQGLQAVIDMIRQNVGISVTAHGSGIIAVAAHHDCAGNPVSDDEHKAQVRAACQIIAQWGYPVRVIGLWVNDWWQIEVVTDSGDAPAAR